MPLKKATLQEIKSDQSAAPLGPAIEVQFNPASLKLELANKVEGGDTKGRQNRQYLGKTSTTLSFDLHFDTADEGTSEVPVSVRTRTQAVEAFVLPKGAGNSKQAPPKARFHWDDLVIDGIIEGLSIDFDLFAPNGTPLRAKMSVSIKEQDAKYQLLQTGPGANRAIEASPPGSPGTGPGSTTGGPADRTAEALEGESAADFAARMGLDPAAWRGIAAQLGASSSVSLSAGISIDFNSSLSTGGGIGFSAGVEASAGAGLDASFGIDATASASVGSAAAGGPAASAAGFALSAAGGVTAAIEQVARVQAESAATSARRSFGSADIPPAAASPRPAMPDQRRTPLQSRAAAGQRLPSATTQAAAPAAPTPPQADRRATTFGYRVPLRPRARVATADNHVDPSRPPWTRLAPGADSRAADRESSRRHPARRCGCSGRCRH